MVIQKALFLKIMSLAPRFMLSTILAWITLVVTDGHWWSLVVTGGHWRSLEVTGGQTELNEGKLLVLTPRDPILFCILI